ncbi:MAG TPA: SPASM domain-containing protein, partial [Oligoflexia bacterium]|nr:SPASM domain-containing protein [Oligoflexia bacterium]
LRFMPLKHNQHQNSEVQAFARDLGVDALTFRKAYLERGSIDCRSEFAPANSVLPGKPSESTSCFSCARPWTNLTVFSGGQVVICENDYNAEYSFGSADDASIRKLLFGRRRRTLLRQFAGNGLPFCRDCEFIDQQSATLNISTISFGGRSPDAPRNQADAA